MLLNYSNSLVPVGPENLMTVNQKLCKQVWLLKEAPSGRL